MSVERHDVLDTFADSRALLTEVVDEAIALIEHLRSRRRPPRGAGRGPNDRGPSYQRDDDGEPDDIDQVIAEIEQFMLGVDELVDRIETPDQTELLTIVVSGETPARSRTDWRDPRSWQQSASRRVEAVPGTRERLAELRAFTNISERDWDMPELASHDQPLYASVAARWHLTAAGIQYISSFGLDPRLLNDTLADAGLLAFGSDALLLQDIYLRNMADSEHSFERLYDSLNPSANVQRALYQPDYQSWRGVEDVFRGGLGGPPWLAYDAVAARANDQEGLSRETQLTQLGSLYEERALVGMGPPGFIPYTFDDPRTAAVEPFPWSATFAESYYQKIETLKLASLKIKEVGERAAQALLGLRLAWRNYVNSLIATVWAFHSFLFELLNVLQSLVNVRRRVIRSIVSLILQGVLAIIRGVADPVALADNVIGNGMELRNAAADQRAAVRRFLILAGTYHIATRDWIASANSYFDLQDAETRDIDGLLLEAETDQSLPRAGEASPGGRFERRPRPRVTYHQPGASLAFSDFERAERLDGAEPDPRLPYAADDGAAGFFMDGNPGVRRGDEDPDGTLPSQDPAMRAEAVRLFEEYRQRAQRFKDAARSP